MKQPHIPHSCISSGLLIICENVPQSGLHPGFSRHLPGPWVVRVARGPTVYKAPHCQREPGTAQFHLRQRPTDASHEWIPETCRIIKDSPQVHIFCKENPSLLSLPLPLGTCSSSAQTRMPLNSPDRFI